MLHPPIKLPSPPASKHRRRAEVQKPDSQYASIIRQNISEGRVGAPEMTLGLLKAAMVEKVEDEGARVFLIDGFPRSMDRALLFESTICKPSLVLLLECSEDVLEKRLLGRAATLGRSDDTVEVIRKRFKTFDHETAEVIGYYEKEGKLRRVDASEEVGVVYRGVELALGGLVCEVAAGGS